MQRPVESTLNIGPSCSEGAGLVIRPKRSEAFARLPSQSPSQRHTNGCVLFFRVGFTTTVTCRDSLRRSVVPDGSSDIVRSRF